MAMGSLDYGEISGGWEGITIENVLGQWTMKCNDYNNLTKLTRVLVQYGFKPYPSMFEFETYYLLNYRQKYVVGVRINDVGNIDEAEAVIFLKEDIKEMTPVEKVPCLNTQTISVDTFMEDFLELNKKWSKKYK